MSTPRNAWWGFMIAAIKRYPARHAELQSLRLTGLSANYSPQEGHTDYAERKTEVSALRTLKSRDAQMEHDAVEAAIDQTLLMKDGAERMEIISHVFWKGYKLDEAALKLHWSVDTIRAKRRDFIYLCWANYRRTK